MFTYQDTIILKRRFCHQGYRELYLPSLLPKDTFNTWNANNTEHTKPKQN